MKRRIVLLASALCLAPAATALSAGYAHDENFVVMAPEQDLADAVLASANKFRAESADVWLGEKLPSSVGRAVIHVTLDETKQEGMFWPVGPNSKRSMHKLWISGNRDQVVGSVLRHEVTHVVMATRFKSELAPWADEGIASRYDDDGRIATRAGIIRWYARTGNWPKLRETLDKEAIAPDDKSGYAVAASLADFLLSRGGERRLLQFAVEGKAKGWDAALRKHYNIANVAELQTQWQDWVKHGKVASTLPAASTRARPAVG
jgi:hypothetical protein